MGPVPNIPEAVGAAGLVWAQYSEDGMNSDPNPDYFLMSKVDAYTAHIEIQLVVMFTFMYFIRKHLMHFVPNHFNVFMSMFTDIDFEDLLATIYMEILYTWLRISPYFSDVPGN